MTRGGRRRGLPCPPYLASCLARLLPPDRLGRTAYPAVSSRALAGREITRQRTGRPERGGWSALTDQRSLVPAPVDAGKRAPIPPTPNGRPPTAVSLSAPETGNDAAVFAELAVHLDRSERRITVCGEIDFAAVPVLADAMYQLIDLEPGDSTIDLAGVSFIAAAGLGCLVGFANQLANSDAKITVVGASDRLRRVFDIVQLGGLLKSS